MNLWHGLPFAADHRIVFLGYPQHAVEQPLAVQDLPRTYLDDETIYTIHGFLASKVRFIKERLIFRQQKWLHLANVAKILVGQFKMRQRLRRLADHLLATLLRRRKDNVAYFAVGALREAART